MEQIPLVDISGWSTGTVAERAAVARALDVAFSASGFALVSGHGVDLAMADDVRRHASAFFHAPSSLKEPLRTSGLGQSGWIPPGMEANGYATGVETPPDLKESLSFSAEHLEGRSAFGSTARWPAAQPGLRDSVEAWISAVDALFIELLQICGEAVGAGAGCFADGCRNAPNTLNINWYPSLADVGRPAEGQYRIGPHTDFGTLTVLDRQQGSGGLQVQAADGRWVDAPWVEGTLTVNVGDLLTMWSGGRWRSALHRVLPPPVDAPDESLISLVYFGGADRDLLVEPLGGVLPAVVAGEYLRGRLDGITVSSI